jgi:hypothetical protein
MQGVGRHLKSLSQILQASHGVFVETDSVFAEAVDAHSREN